MSNIGTNIWTKVGTNIRLKKNKSLRGFVIQKKILRHIQNKCGYSESFTSENTSH